MITSVSGGSTFMTQIDLLYRIGQSQEVVEIPVTLSGEDVLPGLSMQIY